ncbi:MAG: hypothetical protein K6348_03420 [Deferribacterales bacterium]
MKKLLTLIALVVIAATVFVTGCQKKEEAPAPQVEQNEAPADNAAPVDNEAPADNAAPVDNEAPADNAAQ